MNLSTKWALIALVALSTSFTAHYTTQTIDGSVLPLVFLAVGVFLYAACIFISIYLKSKELKQNFDFKEGLQQGLKTGMIALVLYSLYHYMYLAYLNEDIIAELITEKTKIIEEGNFSLKEEKSRIAQLQETISPFKMVTSSVLNLLFIASITSISGTLIVKVFISKLYGK